MLRRLVSASRYHHPNGTTPYHRALSSVVVSALAPAPRTRQQVQQSLDTSVHAFIDMVQQLRHRPPRRNPTADDTRETKAPPSPPSPLDALQHASPAHVIAHVRSLSASEADEVVTYTVGRKRLQAALFVVEALGPGTLIFLFFLLLISATVFMFHPRPFIVSLPSGVSLPAATSSTLLKLVRQRGTAWDLKRLRMALAPVAPDAIANGPATLRLTVCLHVPKDFLFVGTSWLTWGLFSWASCRRGT